MVYFWHKCPGAVSLEWWRIGLTHRIVLWFEPTQPRSLKRGAVCGQRWPVRDRLARHAVPDGVPAAAVTAAGDVTDEYLVGAEWVAVGAVRRCLCDPLPTAADEVARCHRTSMRRGADRGRV
jgi:hypothetical protein